MNDGAKLNVLVVHANWNNRGDEAAIRAMIDSIRELLPIGQIKMMIRSEMIEEFVYKDVEVLRYYPVSNLERVDSLLSMILLGKKSFTQRGRKFIRAVDAADIVIHAPGGPTIGDMYGNWLTRYDHLYRVMFPRLIRRKKLFFYAPSMGPFRSRLMNVLRYILLSRVDTIVLREGVSAKYLSEQLGLDSVVTLDSAYQNTVPEDYVNRYPDAPRVLDRLRSDRVVGMTIADFEWHPELKNRSDISQRVQQSMSGFTEYLIGRGYSIMLIPQLFDELDDASMLEKFREVDPEKVFVLPPDIDSYGQQVFISKLHSMVGMRYHSCIFAAKGNVPFISISYEHKMGGFMKLVELEDMSIEVDDLSIEVLKSKFEELERRRAGIVAHLIGRNPELVSRSRRTSEILAKALRRGPTGEANHSDSVAVK